MGRMKQTAGPRAAHAKSAPPGTWEAHFESWQEFEETLECAEANAKSGWAMGFVADLKARVRQYGARVFLTETQADKLKQIAGV